MSMKTAAAVRVRAVQNARDFAATLRNSRPIPRPVNNSLLQSPARSRVALATVFPFQDPTLAPHLRTVNESGVPQMRAIDSLHRMTRELITALQQTPGLTGILPASEGDACASVPPMEYQDAQALINEDTTFGPVVKVITAPIVKDLTDAAQFDNTFRPVAFAEVEFDATKMSLQQYRAMRRYADLSLDPGVNCVFLIRKNGKFSARITKPTAGCTEGAAALAEAISVTVVSTNELPDSIPPASRIIEGKNMKPFIGVRCARAWCVIGATTVDDLIAPAHADALEEPNAPPISTRTRLDAWFDEQHLAVWDEAKKKLVPGFRASIVPDAGLLDAKLADFDARLVPVAFVWAGEEPPAKYKERLGFRKGWNRLFVQRIDGQSWFSTIIDAEGGVHVRAILPYSHATGFVRGSGRWAWQESDEWIWVPCDNGCCLIQEGSDLSGT
jgi:hypothetical protein